MEIGDEILIRVKVVNFDSNPHGSAIEVAVPGYMDLIERGNLSEDTKLIKFWIHRVDQPKVIVKEKGGSVE